jgi:hypothetical protein
LKGGEIMLKIYEYNGKTYQFEEGEQPAGAVEVQKTNPEEDADTKIYKPANKARRTSKK